MTIVAIIVVLIFSNLGISMEKETENFSDLLPLDVILKIYKKLECADQENFCMTCKNLNKASLEIKCKKYLIMSLSEVVNGNLSYCCSNQKFFLLEKLSKIEAMLTMIDGCDLENQQSIVQETFKIDLFSAHDNGVYIVDDKQIKFLDHDGGVNIFYHSGKVQAIYCVNDFLMIKNDTLNILDLIHRKRIEFHIPSVIHAGALTKDIFIYSEKSELNLYDFPINTVSKVTASNGLVKACATNGDVMITCYEDEDSPSLRENSLNLRFVKAYYGLDIVKNGPATEQDSIWDCKTGNLEINLTKKWEVQNLFLKNNLLFIFCRLSPGDPSRLMVFSLTKNKIVHREILETPISYVYLVGDHFFALAEDNSEICAWQINKSIAE